MSYALENQRDWHTSHDWVLDRLDAVPPDGLSVPDGYSADGLGNLLAHNESESYERALDDTEPQFIAVTTDSLKEVDVEGHGKHRRVANTQYKDFWQH